MTIIGDVHYYRITPASYFSANKCKSRTTSDGGYSKSPSSAGSGSSFRSILSFQKFNEGKSKAVVVPTFESAQSISEIIRQKFTRSQPKQRKEEQHQLLHIVVTDPVNHFERGENRGRSRRPSADDIFTFVAKSCPDRYAIDPFENQQRGIGNPSQLSNYRRIDKNINRRASSLSRVESKPAIVIGNIFDGQSMSSFKDLQNNRNQIEDKFHLHAASYRNDCAADFYTKKPLSIEDWVALHCGKINFELIPNSAELSANENLRQRQGNGTNLEKENSEAVNLNENRSEELEKLHNLNLLKPGYKLMQSPLGKYSLGRPQPPIFYEAIYYASDDDFLMKSTVRTYFKENSLDSNDSVLFSIPQPATIMHHENLEPHPALPGFQYMLEIGSNGLRNQQNGMTSVVTLFLMKYRSALKYIAIIYIIAGSLLIYFFVPNNFVYPAALFLILILCIACVFVVEIGN